MSGEVLEGFRLSPQQRALWSLQQRHPGLDVESRCAIWIDGDLDRELLGRALVEIWNRHEILRTYFPTLPGLEEPLQAIAGKPELVIEERSAIDALFELEQEPRRVAHRLPAISDRPASRIELAATAPRRHLLLVTVPGLCADARSLELLRLEIAQVYSALRDGRELAPASIQYADVAQWLNDLLESEMAAAGQSYWSQALPSDLRALDLPFQRPTPEGGAGGRRVRRVPFASGPSARLENAAARIGCPRSALLLAGIEILIARFTGATQFVIERSTDGRRLEELRTALGPLARILPWPCRVPEEGTFADFASEVARGAAEQELWQEYLPVDGSLGVPIQGTAPPVAGFDYREMPEAVLADGVSFALAAVETPRRPLPLQFTGGIGSNRSVDLRIEYDSGRFSDEDIESFARSCAVLLEHAIEEPDTAIARLPALNESQRSQILVAFNETENECFPNTPVHCQFEEQVARTPDAIALVFENDALSFREVNARANRLARRLREAGVGPESVVGLLFERSLETVIALLAVWKAGGAYLPLEVSTPRQRHKFMLEDAGANVLLTEESFRHEFSDSPWRVFSVEEIREDSDARDEGNLPGGAGPENLAYVLYTSGSTGQPKGVAIEHRQLANYVNAIVDRLRPPAGSSFATVSTFAADLGHTAIFPPLVFGGCLHVIAQERASDSDALSDYFRAHSIDYLKIVPSHLAALLAGAHPEGVLPRRGLVLGGEALTWELAGRIRELAPHCRIWNHYGPTETTVGATSFEMAISEVAASRTIPIGKPLANVRAYVLDRFLEPVPLWAPGELYIAGNGVARGYQNRPELTRERFVSDPSRPGSRMYRTGDLARFLPDGNIEWLGRTDLQVKLRGFRVELGEIEAKLREHPAVSDSVVLLREDAPSEKRLVAYCVFSEAGPATEQELREFLRKALPEFMIPSAFVSLKRLPLTANGKLDRHALPAPDPVRRDSPGELMPPRNSVEAELARIWQEVLRLERVGIHDNFFHLGGDSILAIQIVARANRAGLRMTPRQLFAHQTVAELGGVVGRVGAVTAAQEPVSGAVPLTPIQHWFFEQNLADPNHYNQSVLIEARERLSPAALEEAVECLVAHHDALRLRLTRGGDGWQQSNAPSEQSRIFSRVDLGPCPTEELPVAIEARASELQASLDLTSGPLLRIALLDLGRERASRLLFIIHHLAVDGISWRILLEDFEAAYTQRLGGRQIELPAKTTSFQEWANRLVTHARSGAPDGELSSWLAQGGRDVRPLPVDFAGGTNTVASEDVVSVSLTSGETRSLLQEVPAAYGTQINDALLTALLQAFIPWTGQRSILVDLEGHGREEILEGVDLARTVGWFTTRFPVLLAVDDPSDIADALKQVKERVRAIPHHGIGYGLLRYLSDKREKSTPLKAPPQPEISFNYLGQLDSRLAANSIFAPAAGSDGPTRSKRQARRYLLSINGGVTGGRLQFSWMYSKNVHRRDTVEDLASRFQEAVRAVIARCLSSEAGGYTPSDFPKAKLSQKALDKLVSRFG